MEKVKNKTKNKPALEKGGKKLIKILLITFGSIALLGTLLGIMSYFDVIHPYWY